MKSDRAICRICFFLPVLFLLQFAACDSSRIISGVYQSSKRVQIQGIDGFDQPRWIEMMLAQFGPDLTGIIRVYDDEQFMLPADGMCPCRYVNNGFISGGEISLSFMSHADCPGDQDTLVILGSFVFQEPDPVLPDLDAGDIFTGYLKSEDEDGTPDTEVVFKRVRKWDQVGELDLGCDDPLIYGGDDGQ